MNEHQFIIDMKAMLLDKDVTATKSKTAYSFRKRSEHSLRVLMHAKRLAVFHPEVNTEALYTAAIFHDVGYATAEDRKNHAAQSEIMVRLYLETHEYDKSFIDHVCFLVKHHSTKTRLYMQDTPIELVLLMEADLLDETGALSIVWDAMASGQEKNPSFIKTYERIKRLTYVQAQTNPMVTKEAKALWEEKRDLVNVFINHLEKDLMA